MPKQEKEPKTIIKHTPGGFHVDTGLFFEQVEDGKYCMWDIDGNIKLAPSVTYGISDGCPINYFPLEKVAWSLPPVPIPLTDKEQLWKDIRKFIYEHLFLPDEALYDVVTSWVFASWLPELWITVPYLFFFGPVASGKTRGLEILQRLAYRGILSSNISSAALFRACEQWKPTIILDETEIYSKSERYEVIGLLNSGYRKGQFAVRVKNSEEGAVLEVFDVFGFKAMAGTQGLAQALESRSILIRMIKNRRAVKLFIDEETAKKLRGQLLMWRMQTLHFSNKTKEGLEKTPECELCELSEVKLRDVPPLNVESGRIQELFQPLLAVANSGRESIVKYAEKMDDIRRFEEKASVEAELIEIILKSETTLEENIFLTKNLAEEFNKDRNEREKWKSRSIGRLMRRLGFEMRHTRMGNGWYIDLERLRYLKEIYLGGDTTPKITSQTSHTSPLS